MIGKRKNKDIVYPRQIAIYIVTQMIPSLPLSKIGQAFGGRDHTTIMHARDKIGKNINDRVIDLQIKDIKNLIFHK